MKSKAKSILSMLLVVAGVVCLCSCGNIVPMLNDNDSVKLLNEKFVALIDYVVAHDSDDIYSMFYPDSTDRDSFDLTMEQIYEYFPVTEGYSWEIGQWDLYKGVGIDNNFVSGQYKVMFETVSEEEAQGSQNQ